MRLRCLPMVRLMIVLLKMYGRMCLVTYLLRLLVFSGILTQVGTTIALEQPVLVNMLL
jgi:hypothetical protein